MAKLEVTKEKEGSGQEYYKLKFILNEENGSIQTLNLLPATYELLENYFRKPKREKKKPAKAPTLQEVKDYFKQEGYQEDTAIKFHKYYEMLEWYDNRGQPVLRWKAKAVATWFKAETKLKVEVKSTSSFFQK